MVINKRLEEMRLNIKTHRRNKAVEQFDQCLKLSFAPLQANISPLSLRNSLQPSENFRSSDLSSFSNRNSFPKKQEITSKNMISQQRQPKNVSTLIQTLKVLSSKISDAKNLLQKQSFSTQKLQKPQTTSFQRQIQFSQILPQSKKHETNEESTLNLESRKIFKNHANCKEKILWANTVRLYYIGPVVRGMIGINDRAYEHLYQSHQFLSCNNGFTPPKTFSPLNLSCHPMDKLKKVLVIDMDETLIHCQPECASNCDIQVEMGEGEKGFISIRPYALSFLKKMSKIYEIIVFTASEQDYADAVLNELDCQGLIKHRLYREHCLKMSKSMFTKDLRIINRDLSQMILVDNSAASFLCQPENAVPILPYLGGEDRELLELEKYLELLTKEEDVRKLNRKTFKLQRYKEFADCEELAAELYEDPTNYY